MSEGRGKRIVDTQSGLGHKGNVAQSTPALTPKRVEVGSEQQDCRKTSDSLTARASLAPTSTSLQWNYDHPRYGTCIPGCPTYSKCHCGCEGQTNLSHKTSAPRSQQRNQPAVFITGHAASIISAGRREKRPADCHPDKEHEAHGMCSSCYKQWRNNGGQRVRIKRISSKRLNWEALRYKRCLELLWEYGYGQIQKVIEQLDKELPLVDKEEVA